MGVLYENKTAPISTIRSTGLTPLVHLHKEIEIIYVEEGSTETFADHNHAYAEKGDLFIAFPNQIHYYKNTANSKFFVVIVSPKILLGLENVFNKNVPSNNVIRMGNDEKLLEYFKSLFEAQGKYSAAEQCGYINLIVSRIMPKLEIKPLIQSTHFTVNKILDYCNRSFKEEITLDSVSEALHLSKYYISHIINKQLKMSFNDYINSLRVSCACDMLKETDAKIADISEEVGFGTIRSFNRVFKELMNTTPVEYRRVFDLKEE